MSAHQMSVVEEFCTEILILNKGKTVLQGNLNKIKNTYKANRLDISINDNITRKEDIQNYLENQGLQILLEKDNNYEIKISSEEDGYKLFNVLAENNVRVNKFEIRKPSLHDIFIEKVGE